MTYNYAGAGLFLLCFFVGFISYHALAFNSIIFVNRFLVLFVFLAGITAALFDTNPWILYGLALGNICGESFVNNTFPSD
jgi:hypothetical protein